MAKDDEHSDPEWEELVQLVGAETLPTASTPVPRLAAYIYDKSDVNEMGLARALTWRVVREAAGRADRARDDHYRPLAAAVHALGFVTDYPINDVDVIPRLGQSASQIVNARGQQVIFHFDPSRLAHRRIVAATAGGFGVDKTALTPSKSATRKVAKALWYEIQDIADNEELLAQLRFVSRRGDGLADSNWGLG